MPAHDVFHAAVKQGLIKEGWTITDDPLVIEFGTLDVYTAFFTLMLAQMAIKRHSVHLIVYDPDSEALLQWIK